MTMRPIAALMLSLGLVLMPLHLPAGDDVLRLFVFGGQDQETGFVDNEVRDSVADLQGKLADRHGLQLVSSRDQADVIVEVLSRQKEHGESITARAGGKPISGSTSDRYIVRARLVAGTYEKELTGMDINFWKRAAADLAKQVEKWIAANRAQVLSRRR